MIAVLVILTATLNFVLTKPSYINSVPVFNEGFGLPVVNVYLTQIPEDVTYFKAEYFSRKSPEKQAEPEQLPKTNESSSYGSDAFISNSSAENATSSTTPPSLIVLSSSNASEFSSTSVSEQNKSEVNKIYLPPKQENIISEELKKHVEVEPVKYSAPLLEKTLSLTSSEAENSTVQQSTAEKENINPKPFLENVYHSTVILPSASVQNFYPSSSAANVFALHNIITNPIVAQTDTFPVTYDVPLRYTNTW